MTTETPTAAATGFTRAILGRTGREVHRLGIASSYGIGAAGVEEAIERGVNYVYWGSFRARAFGEGIRNACARGGRERLVLVVQSYTRAACLLGWSLRRALRALATDYADVLLLGWWNKEPPARILDAALALKEAGIVRHIALSTHERPLLPRLAGSAASPVDIFHVRYNAVHRGAEREVFAPLPEDRAARPGLVSFTATRWGSLLRDVEGAPGPVPTAGDCYRFVLTHPSVDVVLSGPRDASDLRAALAAVERGPMTEEELAWMRERGRRIYESEKRRPYTFQFLRGMSAPGDAVK